MCASDESSPTQALPSQTSDLMRAQGCCEGFCDDQTIAGHNQPDVTHVRSDLSEGGPEVTREGGESLTSA